MKLPENICLNLSVLETHKNENHYHFNFNIFIHQNITLATKT